MEAELNFKDQCPEVAQELFRAMEIVMSAAGYPAGVQGL